VSIFNAGVIAQFRNLVIGDGAPVTFTYEAPGAHDPVANAHGAPAVTTVAGHAVGMTSDPDEFEPGEMVEREPAEVLFFPDDGVTVPPKGATVTWQGRVRTVHRRFPIWPAGVTFACRLELL
jgi:hypothetical protein